MNGYSVDRVWLACDLITRILLTHRGQDDVDDVLVCTSHRHLHGNSVGEGEARAHQHVVTSPEHACGEPQRGINVYCRVNATELNFRFVSHPSTRSELKQSRAFRKTLEEKIKYSIKGNVVVPARKRMWEFLFSGTLSERSHGCMPRKVMMLLMASVESRTAKEKWVWN